MGPAGSCRFGPAWPGLFLPPKRGGKPGAVHTDTRAFRDSSFTTLLGAEVHFGAMSNGELWHILAVGLPLGFEPRHAPGFLPVEGQETGAELAKRCREAGAFVAIAHPQWSGLTMDDARTIDAAHAVEVYNHGCAIGCDRADGWHTADLLLNEGRQLFAVATDDAHFTEPDHFGGWVMVNAEANEPEALLHSLKAGAFYSTQGPQIVDIEIGDSVAHIRCSAASAVIIQGHGSAAVAVHGHSMTRADVPLARFFRSPWLRVTVVDAAGRRAWSNPIWRQA